MKIIIALMMCLVLGACAASVKVTTPEKDATGSTLQEKAR